MSLLVWAILQSCYAERPARLANLQALQPEERWEEAYARGGHSEAHHFGEDDPCMQEREALLEALWSVNMLQKGYRFPGDHCEWPGIACSHCMVTEVVLQAEAAYQGRLYGSFEPFGNLLHLQRLHLPGEHVYGRLMFLSSLHDLKTLSLDGKGVSGSLTALSHCSGSLQTLWLPGTQVDGDLQAVDHFDKLETLSLQMTNVFGNIQVLQDATAFVWVDLHGTLVTGDIRVFQALPELYHLDVGLTQVTGDIEAFHGTRKLQFLNAEGASGIFGNIQVFQKTPELHTLTLALTSTWGDINVFTATRKLSQLFLQAVQVDGDIRALHGLSFQRLMLDDTKVEGDVQFLSINDLFSLGMSNTKVFGDISVFKNASNIAAIYLHHTEVCGDIAAFQHASLAVVDLSHSQVHGDIGVWKGHQGLSRVFLPSTNVEGDVQVFAHAFNLQMLDLSSTQVEGNIQVFSGRPALSSLRLSSTRVSGDLGSLVAAHWVNTFELIDLSFTETGGNIWVLKHAKKLKEIYLGDTQVAGSIDGIIGWKAAEVIDLSRTPVTGRLTRHWRGCCKELRSLKLSESGAAFMPSGSDLGALLNLKQMETEADASDMLFPKLNTLQVSGCPLRCPVEQLIRMLSACLGLSSIMAAGCGLLGDLPSLSPMGATVVGRMIESHLVSGLAASLEVLDLSRNNLTSVVAIPPSSTRMSIDENAQPLKLLKEQLVGALHKGITLNLRNTQLEDGLADSLLSEHTVSKTKEMTFINQEKGFRCYDLDHKNTTLWITPSVFLPSALCGCLPGWKGQGADCRECAANEFNPKRNQSHCQKCPEGTESKPGSTSLQACRCHNGRKLLYRDGVYACGCPLMKAISNDSSCLDCQKFHLNCSVPHAVAATAPPMEGFARLIHQEEEAFKCLAPGKTRCPGWRTATPSGCAAGYEGTLCMTCSKRYYAIGRSCEKCSHGSLPSWLIKAGVIASLSFVLAISLAFLALFFGLELGRWAEDAVEWLKSLIFAKGVLGSLQQKLLRVQAPILLQMVQLWAVLGTLASNNDQETGSNGRFWELSYVKNLQLVLGDLKELLYLQCSFHAPSVRLFLGLLTPMVPLLLLLCCCFLECCRRGAGVHAALKVLTVLFIGGASKCMSLSSCQRFDADGDKLEDEFAFLRQLPDLRCEEAYEKQSLKGWHVWVTGIFWPCVVAYGVLIPCFLFYIYARQHIMLRYKRVPLDLQATKGQLAVGVEEQVMQRRLVAAAVGYVAVAEVGSVELELRDGRGIVTLPEDEHGLDLEGDGPFKDEDKRLRHHAITEMLLEQCILEELGESDRVLLGARETLLKYASCRDLWMEVVLKLVAVALVKVVSAAQVASISDKEDWSMALVKIVLITLFMAGVVWMVRPYALPQVDDLQICCFLSLAASSIGFGLQMPWLSRSALLAPLLLALGQLLRPDSPESLARRLWEELLAGGVNRVSGHVKTSVLEQKPRAISLLLKASRG